MQPHNDNNASVTTAASSSSTIPATAPSTTSTTAPANTATAAPPVTTTTTVSVPAPATAPATAPPAGSTVPPVPTAGARVYHAITALNLLPATLRRAAEAAGASQRHFTELESWLEGARASIDSRTDRLTDLIGSESLPSNAARLHELLQPFPVPARFVNPVPAAEPEVDESSPQAADDEDAAEDTAIGGEGRPENEPRDGHYLSDCSVVVYHGSRKRYVELRCNVCKGNCGKVGNFIKGIIGFQRHYKSEHGENLSRNQVFARLTEGVAMTIDEASRVIQPGGRTVSMRMAGDGTQQGQGQAGPSGTAGAGDAGEGSAGEGDAGEGEGQGDDHEDDEEAEGGDDVEKGNE